MTRGSLPVLPVARRAWVQKDGKESNISYCLSSSFAKLGFPYLNHSVRFTTTVLKCQDFSWKIFGVQLRL
jgi:hypothetical protein